MIIASTKQNAGISFTLTLQCKPNNKLLGNKVAHPRSVVTCSKRFPCIESRIRKSLSILALRNKVPLRKGHITIKVRAYPSTVPARQWQNGGGASTHNYQKETGHPRKHSL